MSQDHIALSLGAILDFPWEVLEYLAWLRQQPSSRDAPSSYLFDDARVRFAVDDGDVLIAEASLRVVVESNQLRLESPRAPVGIVLDGLKEPERQSVQKLLELCDGQRTLAEVRMCSPGDGRSLEALLQGAFGRFVFAPLAVSAAEQAISGIEITRFPASPYEISRPYWKNMAAVRRRLPALDSTLHDDELFLAELRRLHVVALMGEDLQTYYQPASPISSGRAAPGRLMRTATEIVETTPGKVLLKGPRVSAAFIGGNRYHELLYRTLEEPEAASPRPFVDSDGLDWGRIVRAKAMADASMQDWFCPPRPMLPGHVRSLREQLQRAHSSIASDRDGCLAALAAFHRSFVRLHPFHCGNQCLAMNIVNRVLGQLQGAGIPHLMLDHLASRLSASAYARVFRRCVEVYLDPQRSAAARYLTLASHRTRTFELTRRLAETRSIDEAESSMHNDTAAAKLLLLVD